MTGQLVKATIKNLDTNESVTCEFNPNSYTFTKTNQWAESQTRGTNSPTLDFTSGSPADLTMELFFDTYTTGEDVRTKYTNALWKLALVNPDKKDPKTNQSRPPVCEFRWGQAWSFKAVVTSITQKFTLFLPDGTPARATVNLSLRQAEDPGQFPFQNPTSGGAAGHRTRVVQQRETLDIIAAQEYGESKHWRAIAEANNIDDPLRLQPGTVLALPPIEEAAS
ncbi:MAG: LysM peptidoglycan-binding domain-containing protein [Dehalococcoidia bacterium]|nr:LysM peptidoglycan-binding domain-containing protein [Dehalococcoidia bacterium]